MYNKNTNSLIKHIDFILQDIILFCLSFWFSYVVRHQSFNIFANRLYISYMVIIILLDMAGVVILRNYKNILYRGNVIELRKTVVLTLFVLLGLVFISFLQKETGELSRIAVGSFFIISSLLIYAGRIFRKKYVIRRLSKTDSRRILLIGSDDGICEVLEKIRDRGIVDFRILGIVSLENENNNSSQIKVLNKTASRKYLDIFNNEIPIVAYDRNSTFEYLNNNIVDEILFVGVDNNEKIKSFIEECELLGITVHLVIYAIDSLIGDSAVEKMAGIPVVSSSIKLVSSSDIFLKRLIDILGSIVGLIITGIAFIFVAPAIYISDPGPIFFSQNRVGKNGRVFKIYKFRSMYQDAERRKAELLNQNQMQGLMFKMENDPRIIGSGKDGTKHGIGWLIRTFSIDELPQFWNIFKGDMSLVGTRPPTVDEWEQYDISHRVRLRIRPGLTGLWQVSGRSNITDFEEVVRLDSEYIRSWSFWKDIEIILKTVKVVFSKEGAE